MDVLDEGVINLISVRPRVTPSEIKRKIEQALLRSVETDAKRITVETQGAKSFSTLPVGTPPTELTVTVSVIAEPGAAVAGATRADLVTRAVTWRGMLSLLGKKVAFRLYRAEML